MAQRIPVDAERARLAGRLRPLYAGLRSDEFDRMVARIAEIELYGGGADSVDIGTAAMRRAHDTKSLPRAMAS